MVIRALSSKCILVLSCFSPFKNFGLKIEKPYEKKKDICINTPSRSFQTKDFSFQTTLANCPVFLMLARMGELETNLNTRWSNGYHVIQRARKDAIARVQ